jgi:hypothetical protein
MATAVQLAHADVPEAKRLTRREAVALFDSTAQLYLGVSGSEFLRRWDSGEFADEEACTSRVMRVACMIPLVRRGRARKNATNRTR